MVVQLGVLFNVCSSCKCQGLQISIVSLFQFHLLFGASLCFDPQIGSVSYSSFNCNLLGLYWNPVGVFLMCGRGESSVLVILNLSLSVGLFWDCILYRCFSSGTSIPPLPSIPVPTCSVLHLFFQSPVPCGYFPLPRLDRKFRESWNKDAFYSQYWDKALELSSGNALILESTLLFQARIFARALKGSFLNPHYQNLVGFSEEKPVKVSGSPQDCSPQTFSLSCQLNLIQPSDSTHLSKFSVKCFYQLIASLISALYQYLSSAVFFDFQTNFKVIVCLITSGL